jgi:hypothetical protein
MSPTAYSGIAVAAVCVATGALVLSVHSGLRVAELQSVPLPALDYVRLVEARVAASELAWGTALCAERRGRLPPSSAKVPAEVERVRGRMYQSRLTDWNDDVFVCADFHLARPQRFQYQWLLAQSGAEGEVVAGADYDGDGAIDHEVRVPVSCTIQGERMRCRPRSLATAPDPFETD